MWKMQPVLQGDQVVGAIVHTPRHKIDCWDNYLVYVKPNIRRDPLVKQAVMDGVMASLKMMGIVPDHDDLGYPVWIGWGVGQL